MNVLSIVTAGADNQDARRARRLLAGIDAEPAWYFVDKSKSRRSQMAHVTALLKSREWDMVFQEGTGIAGGLSLIRESKRGLRYIVSSGDPIAGFFRVTEGRAKGALMSLYERALYRRSAGFVGWTPYLTAAALALGAPTAVTVEGGVDIGAFCAVTDARRAALKLQFGIPAGHLVCGVAGSIRWVENQKYCYGLELVEILKRLRRTDITMLIVGDGTGLAELRKRVPERLCRRVVFTGRLPGEAMPDAMGAMDIGFVTQTLNELGNFRLTTKLPEYLASGLPVAMSPVPGYFDYVGGAGWPLPARHPGSPEFHEGAALWLDDLSAADVESRRGLCRQIACERFDNELLTRRFQTWFNFAARLGGTFPPRATVQGAGR